MCPVGKHLILEGTSLLSVLQYKTQNEVPRIKYP